jgi:hypothetical protein
VIRRRGTKRLLPFPHPPSGVVAPNHAEKKRGNKLSLAYQFWPECPKRNADEAMSYKFVQFSGKRLQSVHFLAVPAVGVCVVRWGNWFVKVSLLGELPGSNERVRLSASLKIAETK